MAKRLRWRALLLAGFILAPALAADDEAQAQRAPSVYVQRGIASWYGPGFHGRKTASGERFDQRRMTAAHRKLPLGTYATVVNLANGKSVRVEITDRGPYYGGRILDLSKAAATRLGMRDSGTTQIRLEVDEDDWAGRDGGA